MKFQKGNTVAIVLGAILGLFLILGVFAVGGYVSGNNRAAAYEAKLQAKISDNQNILSNYGKKVKEVAQVPEMYSTDLTKVTQAAITGRYGDGGSKAVFQAIKEHNPTFDSSLYKKVQVVIESGRDEFKSGQSELVDMKAQYQIQLNSVWSGFWMHLAGYPKIDLNAIKPVTDDRTDAAFKAGKEEAIKLR